MPAVSQDVGVLRDLAKRYLDVCHRPVQAERRRLWRDHNSLVPTRPLVFVRGGVFWQEVREVQDLQCEDKFYRNYEQTLRRELFQDTFGDDTVFEPWVTVRASHTCTGWGLSGERRRSDVDAQHGTWKMDYPLKDLGDVEKLRRPRHAIDEAATARRAEKLADAVGDILPVNVDRSPAYKAFGADLSTDLGYLRGIENFMLDMMDNPQWLHGLMAFLRDGVLAVHEQAEVAGDWCRSASDNQAVAYSNELDDPAPNADGVKRSDLWTFAAAQEFTLISPAMHEEFLLNYQRPIVEAFGLSSYGCCEDLTNKIDMLRPIKNLRRIAVTPVANVRRCAEQIGMDYVMSWRPNPAETVSVGFDADRIRTLTRDGLQACRGQHVDITLKDIQTVENAPRRLTDCVRLMREVIDEVW